MAVLIALTGGGNTPPRVIANASIPGVMRTAPWKFTWTPGYANGSAPNDYPSFVVTDEDNTAALFYEKGASSFNISDQTGTSILTFGCTWGSGATLTFRFDPVANTLTVSGATTGNAVHTIPGPLLDWWNTTDDLAIGSGFGGGFATGGTYGDIEDDPPPSNDGTIAASLDGLTAALAGTLTDNATVAASLDGSTAALASTMEIGGTVAAVVDAPVAALSNGDIAGTVAATVDAPTASSAGTLTLSGSVAASMDAPVAVAISGPAWPLKVSANARYLTDQNDVPFPLWTDAAWMVVNHAPDEDVAAYIEAIAARGFKAFILMNLVHAGGSGWPNENEPADEYDNDPFTTPDHLDTPNSAYFARVSAAISLARSHGLAVEFFHTYLGYASGADGWGGVLNDAHNTNSVCFGWGVYLANTFPQENIIWMHGGDDGLSGTPLARFQQIVAGIQSVSRSRLSGSEWAPPDSLVTAQSGFTYGTNPATSDMQLNTFYGAGPSGDGLAHSTAAAAYANSPTLPAKCQEPAYENAAYAPDINDREQLRRVHHWCFCEGAIAGITVGAENRWDWQSANDPLDTITSSPATNDAVHAFELHASLPWHTMRPSGTATDYAGRVLVVSGLGSGASKVTSCMSSAGSHLLAYVPPTGTGTTNFSVDLRSMSGPSRARWWNPTTGGYTDITGGSYSLANSLSAQSFTTPGNNGTGFSDWVLVLDVEASIAGTVAASLDGSTASLSGTLTNEGTVAATVDASTASASGTMTNEGTVAASLDGSTASASGTLTNEGTVAATVDASTAAAASTMELQGTVAASVDPPTIEILSNGDISGTVAATVDASTAAAVATIDISGTVAAAMDAATASAASTMAVDGTVAAVVDPPTLLASGAGYIATIEASVDVPEAAVAGTLEISGSVAASLDPPTLEASGPSDGSVIAVLDPATAAAAGTLEISGSVAATVDAEQASAAGTLTVPGTVAAVEAELVAQVAANLSAEDSVLATMAPLEAQLVGEMVIGGSVAASVDPAMAAAATTMTVVGAVDAQLDPLTAAASDAVYAPLPTRIVTVPMSVSSVRTTSS